MRNLYVPIAVGVALAAGFGCRNQAEPDGDATTNSVAMTNPATNVLNPAASAVTYPTEATNVDAQSVWQKTKAESSNAWSATGQLATNAWQETKETSSNVLEKTSDLTSRAWNQARQAWNGVATNDISTNYFADDFSMKEDFVSGAQTNLDYVDARIEALTTQAKGSASADPDLQQTMQTMKDKRAELADKFEVVKNATADGWNDAKSAYAKTYYDLSATLKAASDDLAVRQ